MIIIIKETLAVYKGFLSLIYGKIIMFYFGLKWNKTEKIV